MIPHGFFKATPDDDESSRDLDDPTGPRHSDDDAVDTPDIFPVDCNGTPSAAINMAPITMPTDKELFLAFRAVASSPPTRIKRLLKAFQLPVPTHADQAVIKGISPHA